jgi:hypothetical protein
MRAVKILTYTVLTLVILALVADRGGKFALERIAAGEMQKSMDTKGRPDVSLGGFPFLPDLIRQRFSTVTVSMREADVGRARVARVDAVLHGVTRRSGGVQAESIKGTGLLTYAAMTQAAREQTSLPARVEYGGDGLVKVTAGVVVFGQDLSASASGRPRIEGNLLIVKPEKASSTGLSDEAATAAANKLPEIRIPLRDVPKGLDISLDPGEAGVRFSFQGRNVFLASADQTAALGSPRPLAVLRPAPVTGRPVSVGSAA